MDRNTGITWNNGYYDSDAVGSHLSVLADTVQSNSLATQTGYSYSAILNVGGGGIDSYRFRLASYATSDNFLFYRGYDANSNKWKNWVEIIHSGNIESQSVNYANSSGYATNAGWASSADNADTIDGIDSTGFLRYYNSHVAPTNVNIVNTPSYVWTVSTTGGSAATATKPYGIDNAWGVIHLHTHIGNYATQLGFGGTTGRMYMRNAYNTETFGNWEGLAFTSDLSSYLPLSGGTMTGYITFNSG